MKYLYRLFIFCATYIMRLINNQKSPSSFQHALPKTTQHCVGNNHNFWISFHVVEIILVTKHWIFKVKHQKHFLEKNTVTYETENSRNRRLADRKEFGNTFNEKLHVIKMERTIKRYASELEF